MTRVMGILNVTPDSFSDGGQHLLPERAVERGRALYAEGAEIVDVGGESTRPGAAAVDVEEELARILPVVRGLVAHGPVSIDTRRAAVARAALEAGATLVNDVSGGADAEMFGVVAASGRAMVLMHMRGTPDHMQRLTAYDDVCAEVWSVLESRRALAIAAGIPPERILLDPGIGFAKTGEQNLELLRDLPTRTRERQVLIGASRKSFIGVLTGQTVASERLAGSLALALHAERAGVAFVRVHDVADTVRALAVWRAVQGAGAPPRARA